MDLLGVRCDALHSFVIIFGTCETMTCQQASFLVFKAAPAQVEFNSPIYLLGRLVSIARESLFELVWFGLVGLG